MRKDPPDRPEERLASDWIRRMADRDVESLDALYGLYHRRLLSLFSAILKDPREAEEVLQDTFVRAYREAGRFDPDAGTPFAWLATIGRRLAIDRLRRRRARPGFAAVSREQEGNPGHKEVAEDDPSVHQCLEFSWVRECLDDLPDAQRQAIELAFLRGYTHREIAEKLGRPLGTVKSDLNRGLLQLRKVYLEGK